MPPSSCDFEIFQVSDFPLSLCEPQIWVGLISVKLLISPISRHAAQRLDLTGEAWASTETTDLQAKLWIENVPKLGAVCWTEALTYVMIPGGKPLNVTSALKHTLVKTNVYTQLLACTNYPSSVRSIKTHCQTLRVRQLTYG